MTLTEKIWQDYQRKLRAFIRTRVYDDATADDILQDTFVNIHRRLNTLKEDNKLESWLYQITRNAIIDHYRNRKITEPLSDELLPPDIDHNTPLKQELATCLEPMINQLDDNYRASVYLSEIAGMKQKEVAEKLNISLSATKSRIQRGRNLLKGMLHECCDIQLNHNNEITDYTTKNNKCC